MICDELRKDIISNLNKKWKEYEEYCKNNNKNPNHRDYKRWLEENYPKG